MHVESHMNATCKLNDSAACVHYSGKPLTLSEGMYRLKVGPALVKKKSFSDWLSRPTRSDTLWDCGNEVLQNGMSGLRTRSHKWLAAQIYPDQKQLQYMPGVLRTAVVKSYLGLSVAHLLLGLARSSG